LIKVVRSQFAPDTYHAKITQIPGYSSGAVRRRSEDRPIQCAGDTFVILDGPTGSRSSRGEYSVSMANIKSQIKRNRQNEKRRLRNRGARSSLRTQVKRFEEAVDSGDLGVAQEEYRKVSAALDKAASSGIIHKNRAATRKARLAKRLRPSG